MDLFLHSVELPFSKTKIFYRELNTKEQFSLAKFSVLYPYGKENNMDFSVALKKVIENCVENKEDLFKLDIIEYILFLTKIRILSVDNKIELQIKPTSEQEMLRKFNINLDDFMKSLYETSLIFVNDNKLVHNNVEIILAWPNIKSCEFLIENNNDISSTLIEFIKSIKIKEKNILFNNLNNKEKNEIYDRLPLKLRKIIQDKIIKNTKVLFEKNLFNIKDLDSIKINLYDDSYLYFIKLLFSVNVKELYQQYYAFASRNINLSFVDKMTSADRRVFYSFIEEEIKSRSEIMYNTPTNSPQTTPLQDLINEFEG